jgi:hypothetical protein
MFDIKNSLKVFKGFSPQTRTADITTQACDLQGFSGAMVIMPVGASSDTLSGTVFFTVTLTHSDDDSTYTDVTSNADVTGGKLTGSSWLKLDAPSDASNVYGIGYVGGKRYLKCTAVKTGTHSNGTIIGIDFIKGHPISAPVSTDSNNGA